VLKQIKKGLVMKIRVYFEDTDIGGIVYHTKYINFCERARSELLFTQGLKPYDVQTQSGFVVKSLACDFLKSATLGDLLEVKSTLLEYSRVTFTLLQEVFRDDEKLFSMKITIVSLVNGKPAKIDTKLLELFE
jgi:acyl-CoA thioester hydrolase